VRLDPGSRLLLYSDGLVERRGEVIDDGLARLAAVAAATRAEDADDAVLTLLRRLADTADPAFEDDLVVLCVDLLETAASAPEHDDLAATLPSRVEA
jgi:serine phosphatase RsbU (regulator of sigma subunit)